VTSEEEEWTLDLLLAQPVPRWSAYLQKAAAVTIGITALTLATWVTLAGYTFVLYVIYGMSATVTWLQNPRPLMLWQGYLLNDPLLSGFSWPDIVVLTGVGLAALAGGVFFFGSRDLWA
jgi:hypothetical protein